MLAMFKMLMFAKWAMIEPRRMRAEKVYNVRRSKIGEFKVELAKVF